MPDLSEIEPTYNEAGLVTTIDARLQGAITWTAFVTNIDYDEEGRRTRIDYDNGTYTEYFYDPLTFRLTHPVYENVVRVRMTDGRGIWFTEAGEFIGFQERYKPR